MGAVGHGLVVMAMLDFGEHVKNVVKGCGGVLAEPAAIRLGHQLLAAVGGQTGAAAQLVAVIIDYRRLQAEEWEAQRVADVRSGLVLEEAVKL